MSNQEIVQKLWNECNVLRDDGVSYQDYITELTYILFLKMSKEQGQEDDIPEKYQWDNLVSKEGLELKNFYRQLLLDLGNPEIVKSERINAIYANASTAIDEPANLEKIIKDIDELDWFSAREEGLGDGRYGFPHAARRHPSLACSQCLRRNGADLDLCPL